MGFQPKRKIYSLDFTGTELEGFEVKIRAISSDQYYTVADISAAAENNAGFIKALLPEMIAVIKSWNLEDEEGNPVPVSAEGLMHEFELKQVGDIISAWLDVYAGVSAPLDQPSDDGGLSLVESLPMEVSSPSQANLLALN